MAKTVAICNQKGGTGKTTTSVNLSSALADLGKRVLLIDMDPQGNATMGSVVDKRELKHTIYDVLLEEATVAEARMPSGKCGYDVLGANRELAGAEVELVAVERREARLKAALAVVSAEYDFILMPSLETQTTPLRKVKNASRAVSLKKTNSFSSRNSSKDLEK